MKKKKTQQKEFNIPIKIYKNEEEIKSKKQFSEMSEGEEDNYLRKNFGNSRSTSFSFKDVQKKKKMMWGIVILALVMIIPVWIIFLKFNILLNNTSSKRVEDQKEWAEIESTFARSYDNIQKFISNFDLREKKKNEIKAESEKQGINPDDVKKLKEKILK